MPAASRLLPVPGTVAGIPLDTGDFTTNCVFTILAFTHEMRCYQDMDF